MPKIRCYLDNCPHHESKERTLARPMCQFDKCAWDSQNITEYLNLVRMSPKEKVERGFDPMDMHTYLIARTTVAELGEVECYSSRAETT